MTYVRISYACKVLYNNDNKFCFLVYVALSKKQTYVNNDVNDYVDNEHDRWFVTFKYEWTTATVNWARE